MATTKQIDSLVSAIRFCVDADVKRTGTVAWATAEIAILDIAKRMRKTPSEVNALLDGNLMHVHNRLPMGWRLAGLQGESVLTILRSLPFPSWTKE